jgi:hypothetical protein
MNKMVGPVDAFYGRQEVVMEEVASVFEICFVLVCMM